MIVSMEKRMVETVYVSGIREINKLYNEKCKYIDNGYNVIDSNSLDFGSHIEYRFIAQRNI